MPVDSLYSSLMSCVEYIDNLVDVRSEWLQIAGVLTAADVFFGW